MAETTTITLTDDIDALVTRIADATGVDKSIVVERATTYFIRIYFAPETLENEASGHLRLPPHWEYDLPDSAIAAVATTKPDHVISPLFGPMVLEVVKEAFSQFSEDLEDIKAVAAHHADPGPTRPWEEIERELGL